MKLELMLASCLIALLPTVVAAADQTATVNVLAFDTMGGKIRSSDLKIESFAGLGSKKDYASRFHNGQAKGIPFGNYKIRVYLTGFVTQERLVRIFQQDTTVVLGLDVGSIIDCVANCLPRELQGRLVGDPQKLKNAFVKVTGVFSNYSAESQVNPDGEFHVTEPPVGIYVLLVVSQDAVISSSIFRMPTVPYGSPLQVEIGAEPVFRWRE